MEASGEKDQWLSESHLGQKELMVSEDKGTEFSPWSTKPLFSITSISLCKASYYNTSPLAPSSIRERSPGQRLDVMFWEGSELMLRWWRANGEVKRCKEGGVDQLAIEKEGEGAQAGTQMSGLAMGWFTGEEPCPHFVIFEIQSRGTPSGIDNFQPLGPSLSA